MRRTAAVACGLACLLLPASASAAVTPDRDAGHLATAIVAPSAAGALTDAQFVPIAPAGNPAAVADSALSDFPQDGSSFAVLSSGDSLHAESATTDTEENGSTEPADGPRPNVNDLTILRLDLTVPATVNCAILSFRFLTDEDPGAEFNDGFIAELDTSDWTTTNSTLAAPHNFAFDDNHNVISVNAAGSASLTPAGATGTGFATGTSRLTAATPVGSGPHSIYLSIFDYADDIVDSAVLVDDLRLEQRVPGACSQGTDKVAPTVRITAPVDHSGIDDTTPTIAGTAGDAPGDSGQVSVSVRSGGSVVQSLTAQRSGTSWSVDAGELVPAQYTVVATQSDASGNVGTSPTLTFDLFTPIPHDEDQPDTTTPPPPVPVLGQSVVAGAVGGTVKIKLKNGKFRTLGANETIPLGSTIDATKGRVRLTSIGPGGKLQKADFYKGQFKVTQTGGKKKPITQLALNATLSCGRSGKASAAKKKKGKKVRSLWGDGHGTFRTRGGSAAATVRGTKWLTRDTCDSTKITVKRGVVQVRDLVKRKNVTVKKGHSYVARKKKK